MRLLSLKSTTFLAIVLLNFCQNCLSEEVAKLSPPIKIGVILPLTTGFATWGNSVRRGLELANKATHHKFNLVFEDEGSCDAQKALTAAQKLINIQKVNILVTGCLNGSKAIVPLINKSKTLLISAGLLDEAIFKDSSNLISLGSQIGNEAIDAAKYINRIGAKKITIIRVQDNFTEEVARVLKTQLKSYGIQILADETSEFQTMDFRTVLTRSASAKPDLFFIYLGGEQTLAFVRQKKELNNNTAVFGGYVIESNSLAPKEQAELDGIKYTSPLIGDENGKSELRTNFDALFKEEYGSNENPTVNTYFAYDGLRMLDVAVESCSSSENLCLKGKLIEVGKNFTGVAGSYNFNLDGSLERGYGLKIVKNGGFEWEK